MVLGIKSPSVLKSSSPWFRNFIRSPVEDVSCLLLDEVIFERFPRSWIKVASRLVVNIEFGDEGL